MWYDEAYARSVVVLLLFTKFVYRLLDTPDPHFLLELGMDPYESTDVETCVLIHDFLLALLLCLAVDECKRGYHKAYCWLKEDPP